MHKSININTQMIFPLNFNLHPSSIKVRFSFNFFNPIYLTLVHNFIIMFKLHFLLYHFKKSILFKIEYTDCIPKNQKNFLLRKCFNFSSLFLKIVYVIDTFS